MKIRRNAILLILLICVTSTSCTKIPQVFHGLNKIEQAVKGDE